MFDHLQQCLHLAVIADAQTGLPVFSKYVNTRGCDVLARNYMGIVHSMMRPFEFTTNGYQPSNGHRVA